MGVINDAREATGMNFSRSAISPKQPKGIMDFRPSKALASGLKRIGGRSGITRLGRVNSNERKGKPTIFHKI